MSEPLQIEVIIPGDWHWLAAVYRRALASATPEWHPAGGVSAHGARWEVHHIETVKPIGIIAFHYDEEHHAATVRVDSAAVEYLPYWQNQLAILQAVATEARQLKRAFKPSADELIERYYRSRAAGGKVTLKQLALQFDYNYKYLSNVKSAYDKRGGWGSKVHTNQDNNGNNTPPQ